jgi:hypothetical protein
MMDIAVALRSDYIDRHVWYGLRMEDIRAVGQPHAAVTRERFQTEEGCFRRKPGNGGRTAIPAQREVVKIKMSDVSLNGGAIHPGLSGPLSEIASLGKSLVEDQQITGSRGRSAERL